MKTSSYQNMLKKRNPLRPKTETKGILKSTPPLHRGAKKGKEKKEKEKMEVGLS